MKKKPSAGHCIIVAGMVALMAMSLYPMWYTLVVSFSDRVQVDAGTVWLLPKGFNLSSYSKLLRDSTFLSSFFVSAKRVLLGCTLNMILMILSAYPLSLPRNKFAAGRYYKWFFLANMIFTGGLIPSYMLVREYQLFNSVWSLILPCAVPLWNMILMINFFRNIPYELNEAASIDGANPWQILFKIYVPLCIPSLACLLLFQFVFHWNSYFDGLIYINDSLKQPLQTYIYQMQVKIDYTSMSPDQIVEALKLSDKTLNAAKVIIAMIPIMCIYPFLQKYFISGMTMGSVKG